VSDEIGCQRAQELFSDDLEGTLSVVLRAELAEHLRGCDDCRALREAMQEVVAALRSHPLVEPQAGLSARAAQAALEQARRARPRLRAPEWPRALRLAAAIALVAAGAVFLMAGPESAPVRAATRLADQTENALFYVAERKDRVLEDVRILRVVIGAAFEGRLDRVNDRFDDYRRILERRRAAAAPDKKKSSKNESNPAHASYVGRTGTGKEPSKT